ncbi:MAG: alpha/beta fold hydrolase [Nostoc sp. LLA-1]|nr:alpha/beta fold hydrolase [Cyanocohniella sp. LLY]
MFINQYSSKWISYPKPNPQADLRLFCFPHAGGNSGIYSSWAKYLPKNVEVCLIELPGHGSRLKEVAYDRLQPLVEAISSVLMPCLLETPFAFFGHSMGALISFELAIQLRKLYCKKPIHLFVSGCRAPQTFCEISPIDTLCDVGFIEQVSKYGGLPDEVLQNSEFMELILPTLRADFNLIASYTYVPELPLDCPMTIFSGLQDISINYTHLKSWQQHTKSAFTIQMFPGNHFFIRSHQHLLLALLSKILQNLVEQD